MNKKTQMMRKSLCDLCEGVLEQGVSTSDIKDGYYSSADGLTLCCEECHDDWAFSKDNNAKAIYHLF